MALYVYNISDGALVSWCPKDTDPVADAATLSKAGLTSIAGLPALDAAHVWDAVQKTVLTVAPVTKTPPPLASGSITINGTVYAVTLT
jgi:hypothetical protein